MDKLTGHDYMNQAPMELMSHPDFSSDVLNKMAKISTMTTSQLEKLNLEGDDNE